MADSKPALESFYTDHWREIEPDRLAKYDKSFLRRSSFLMKHYDAQEGEHVVDFGCGPGHLSAELAGIVGEKGQVTGLDVNADFIARSTEVAAEHKLSNVSFQVLEAGAPWPLGDSSVDRVIFKNVLEYVPSVEDTLAEAFRCLRPGGVVKCSDSDWGFLVVEPLTPQEVSELYGAAGPAFKDPYIGRHLRNHLQRAGLEAAIEISSGVIKSPAVAVNNMFNYARQLQTLTEERAAELQAKIDKAVDDGEFYMVLPQFLATGTKGGGKARL